MKKIHLYDKILFPVVTEKSTNLSDQNKIIFKGPNKTNKINVIPLCLTMHKPVHSATAL